MAKSLRLAGVFGAIAFCAGDNHNPHPDMGGYTPASNVVEHSQMVFDIKDITTATSAGDFAAAKEIYTGGRFSCKSPSTTRTLQGFVSADTYTAKLQGEAFMDTFAGGDGDQIPGDGRLSLAGSFWDDFILGALDGTGDFEGKSETMRKTAVKKGILGALTMYSTHELEAAVVKARDGNFDDASGAPHAWDEGWAFYYGSFGSHMLEPMASDGGKYSAWEFAKKRDLDYAYDSDGDAVAGAVDSRVKMLEYFKKGLKASRNDDVGGADTAVTQMIEARNNIYSMLALASIRAALKYAEKTQAADGGYSEDYHIEAYAYFLAAAGWVEQAAPGVGSSVLNLLDFKKTSEELDANLYCAVEAALIPAYEPLGLDCDMVGVWKDHNSEAISCEDLPACPTGVAALPDGLADYIPDTETTAGSNTDCPYEFPQETEETTAADAAPAAAGAVAMGLAVLASLANAA